MWIYLGLGLLMANLLAVGTFTGHTERLFRRFPLNRYDIIDAASGKGAYADFTKVWAIGVFVSTPVIVLVALLWGGRP